jgi:hypothetical protein
MGGVKYSSGEVGGFLRRASDKELPPAALTCKIARVEADRNNSVSKQVQAGREIDSIWCRNIFADHPPEPASADHGKEPSGHVGVARRSTPTRSGPRRAWISTANNICCGWVIDNVPNVA